MTKIISASIILLAFAGNIGFAKIESAVPREIISLDAGWKFQLGENTNAIAPTFDDHGWRSVDVPHDYVPVARADAARTFDKGTFPHSEHLAAYQPP